MKKVYISILALFLSLHTATAVAEGAAAFADILVWQASEQTASYWATFVKEPSSTTVDLDETNVNFNWDLGFRGGVTYETKHSLWDSALYWTYFSTQTSTSYNAGRAIIIPQFFSGFLANNFFFAANLNWRLLMNMVDFEVGHKFHPANSVTIRPAIGVKGGTIYQAINANWFADIYTATENVKNNFFGLGPTFRLDTTWNVFRSVNIFGNFATAFMWGHWNVTDVYSRPYAALGLVTPTIITTNLNKAQLGTIMLDYCLGLEWIYTGRSIVTVQIGYEMQYWANQLRIATFQQIPVHGDLTLQGGTCRIRVDL